MFFILSLLLLCQQVFTVESSKATLLLSSDEPVLLDTQLTVHATLLTDDEHHEYTFYFKDNTGVGGVHTVKAKKTAHFTKMYSSRDYSRGTYKMSVEVSKDKYRIASNETRFTITEQLTGKIIHSQSGLPSGDTCCVAVNKTVNFTVSLHDPSESLQNATIYYVWNIEGNTPSEKNVSYNFTHSGEKNVGLTVLAITNKTILTGYLRKSLTVKNPIENVSLIIKPFLKRGELFVLKVTWNGSSPYNYCILNLYDNQTESNETCSETFETTSANLIYTRYYPKVGDYRIFMRIENDVSTFGKAIQVKIYDVSHTPQLSIVIIPVVCSILAVIIIAVGIALFIHNRNSYLVEVADFDFQQPESMMEKTFFERLYDSFKNPLCSQTNSANGDKRRLYSYCDYEDDAVATLVQHQNSTE